jgi:hypothetical protein
MQSSMEIYPRTAAERAMKLQEVLLRATAGKIKWWQAELIGISPRQMRRWRKRLGEQGYKGLLDRRRGSRAAGACRRSNLRNLVSSPPGFKVQLSHA